jgi:hypothetical protein
MSRLAISRFVIGVIAGPAIVGISTIGALNLTEVGTDAKA